MCFNCRQDLRLVCCLCPQHDEDGRTLRGGLFGDRNDAFDESSMAKLLSHIGRQDDDPVDPSAAVVYEEHENEARVFDMEWLVIPIFSRCMEIGKYYAMFRRDSIQTVKLHEWHPFLEREGTADTALAEREFHFAECRVYYRSENQCIKTSVILYFHLPKTTVSTEDQNTWGSLLATWVKDRGINMMCGYVGGNPRILEVMAASHKPLSYAPFSLHMHFNSKYNKKKQ